MNLGTVGLILLCLLLSACASEPATPREGDPLTGTWSGEWGTSGRRDRVELELEWDGTNLEGTVNPRSNGLDLEKTSFDPATGSISMEFDAYDDGRTVHYVIDGKLTGSTITGTWTRNGQTGDFQVTKD